MLIFAWALSLVMVAAIARAQTPVQRGATPSIIYGGDVGFRVSALNVSVETVSLARWS